MNNKIYNTGQLIFDIDTKEAEKLYGLSYKDIYKKIKNYLTNIGFNNIQGSGYEAELPIDKSLMVKIIKNLKIDLLKYNFDLDKVIKEMHIGFIDHSHSLNYLFDRARKCELEVSQNKNNLNSYEQLTIESIYSERKQLIFDLDTIWLDENLLGGRSKAYSDIKKFLLDNNFSKIEYSCYLSNNDISDKELTDIITRLKQKHPYLNDCIKDIRYSNMKDFHSLAHLFDHSRKLHKVAEETLLEMNYASNISSNVKTNTKSNNINKLNDDSLNIQNKIQSKLIPIDCLINYKNVNKNLQIE